MTSQEPADEARSTPDGDALMPPGTESLRVLTESGGPVDAAEEAAGDDAPTGSLRTGAADAAVRGVDEVLGREVRLVTLPPASGELLSERIEQVRHLARLHHPHLLEVYDVDGLAPDTESTLVLESVPGEPLPLVLRDGPIAEPALARMGAQLASALAHAHAHGVEHGAIGAASILVDRANSDAWLVGLTASLSGPLPIVDPEADDDGDGAARRRDADVRALAATLTEVVEHGEAVDGGDDAEAVTRPSTRDDTALTPLAALLRTVDSPNPPSAGLLSERLVRVARGGTNRPDHGAPARLVPVVASWSESPAAAGAETPEVPAALAGGPAVRARGAGGVTPFAVMSSPAARRARRAGVLGAATATLALASGLVIWAGESHVVRSESQAEIGASAPPASAAAPLVPRPADAGASGGGGSGSSSSGSSSSGSSSSGGSTSSGGSDDAVVGVASRRAALRAAPSRSATESPAPSRTSDVPPPTSEVPPSSTPPRTRPSGPPRTSPPATTSPSTRPTTTRPTTTAPPTTQATTTAPPTSEATTTPPSSSTAPDTDTGTTTTAPDDATTEDTTTADAETTTPATTTTTPLAQVLAAGR